MSIIVVHLLYSHLGVVSQNRLLDHVHFGLDLLGVRYSNVLWTQL